MQIEEKTGVEQSCEDHRGRLLESVSAEPRRDQSVIVRPDRSIVIGHRIVARLAASHRTDAPTGERRFFCKRCRNAARVLLCRNTGEKTMPRVRCSHPARLLASIQCNGVSTKIVAPKRLLEATTECLCLL